MIFPLSACLGEVAEETTAPPATSAEETTAEETAPPEEEVRAALRILESCEVRPARPEIVSCPTCGRTEIDLERLAREVEDLVARLKSAGMKLPVRKLAVMGCPVNGPGEARDADLGLAGTRSGGVILFRRGKVLTEIAEKRFCHTFSVSQGAP